MRLLAGLSALVLLPAIGAGQEPTAEEWIGRALADRMTAARSFDVFRTGDARELAVGLGERFLAAAERFDHADVEPMEHSLVALRQAGTRGRPAAPWLIAGVCALENAPAANWDESPTRTDDRGRSAKKWAVVRGVQETLESIVPPLARFEGPIPELLRGLPRPALMDGLLLLRSRAGRRPLIESAMIEWFPMDSRATFLDLTDPSLDLWKVANYLRLHDEAEVAERASETVREGGRNEAVRAALILARQGWPAREHLVEGLDHSVPDVRRTCLEGLVALIGPSVRVTELEERRSWLLSRFERFERITRDESAELRALAFRLLHDITFESRVLSGPLDRVHIQLYAGVREEALAWEPVFERGRRDPHPAVCFWAASAAQQLQRDEWSILRILAGHERLRARFSFDAARGASYAELAELVQRIEGEGSDAEWATVLVFLELHLDELIREDRIELRDKILDLFERRVRIALERPLSEELFCYGEVERGEDPRLFAWYDIPELRRCIFGRKNGWFGTPAAEAVRQLECDQGTVRDLATEAVRIGNFPPEVVQLSMRLAVRLRLAEYPRYAEQAYFESLDERGVGVFAAGLDDPFPHVRRFTCKMLGHAGERARAWRVRLRVLAETDPAVAAAARTALALIPVLPSKPAPEEER